MCIQVSPQLMQNQRAPGGGDTWTLASVTGHMLGLAESRYGRRDHCYTSLGVEFRNGDPQIWFPGNCRHVVIQLSNSCLSSPHQACFQLAHEVIHLLSPTGGAIPATNLEEGLANYFQSWYMQNEYHNLGWPPGQTVCVTPSYLNAEQLVSQLMTAAGAGAIATLRQAHPTLSTMTAQFIQATFPAVSNSLAQALTQLFVP